ncbi:DedA family protein, partial [Vibrio alginolyticus]
AKMSRKEFLLGNALATTIWVAVFSLLTNFAFEHLSVLSQFYTEHRYVVWSSAALLFSLMIFALLKRKKA